MESAAQLVGIAEAGGAARPLRVAHVTATFPPYWGGTGNVVWHQSRELAARGHDVHVFTAQLGRTGVGPPGVEVHRQRPLLRFGNAPLLPGLTRALRGFELVHLHYPFYFGAEAVWAASRLHRVPYVVTYHHDVVFAGLLAALPRLHHRLVGQPILRAARQVHFTTLDYARSSLAAELVDSPRAREVPIGVDLDRFAAGTDARPAVRAALGCASDEVVALFVGNLDRAHFFKGLDVLLRAHARVRAPRLRLLVVGDGDLRPRYERLARALDAPGRVTFTGTVSAESLPGMYCAADMVVLPSVTRGEAFGVVLLEAMAASRPVVASELPGVRAVVAEAAAGVLVPPGDEHGLAEALRTLAADPARRAAVGAQGRRAAEDRYAWAPIAARLEACYRGALSGGEATPSPLSGRAPHR